LLRSPTSTGTIGFASGYPRAARRFHTSQVLDVLLHGQRRRTFGGMDSRLGASRMVTVAKWRDGAIAEEYIWI
jgi:hypothetical protein